jgi:hypothetical protein
MARMVRDGAVSSEDDDHAGLVAPQDADDDSHRAELAQPSKAPKRAKAAAAATASPPQHVAGLPLVARPPLSADDVEVLREYLLSRRTKLSRSRLRLIGFASVVVALLIVLDGALVLRVIGGVILAFALVLGLLMMADWRRQRVLVEADLREGFLCRYEGVVDASRAADHALVKNGVLRVDGAGVQQLDVLPVSRKVHRTNGALQWTWCQVRE